MHTRLRPRQNLPAAQAPSRRLVAFACAAWRACRVGGAGARVWQMDGVVVRMDDTWPKEEIAPGVFADVDPATLGPSETERRASNLMACALWAELHEKAGEGVLPEKLPKAAADLLRGLMLDKFRADLAQAPAPVRVKPDVDAIENGGKRWHGEDHRVVSVRWEPYKPDGARQMKAKGRWQEQVGSGDYWRWQNCERPQFLAALEAPDAGVVAELVEAIGAEARRYAGFYPQGSDGQNTFVMFAEWVETRALALIAHNTTEG